VKVKAIGHKSGKYCLLEDNRWVEINPATGDVLREIKPRRFVEYDDQGNIVAVHDIEFSCLLEEAGPAALFVSPPGQPPRKWLEVDDKHPLRRMDGRDLIKKHRVGPKGLEPKTGGIP